MTTAKDKAEKTARQIYGEWNDYALNFCDIPKPVLTILAGFEKALLKQEKIIEALKAGLKEAVRIIEIDQHRNVLDAADCIQAQKDGSDDDGTWGRLRATRHTLRKLGVEIENFHYATKNGNNECREALALAEKLRNE